MTKYKGILENMFSKIDFFSILPSSIISYRNKEYYSNLTGKILSVFIIIICFLTFYYFGLNMYYRQKPELLISESYQAYPEYLNITKENFFFSFALHDSIKYIIDESIYIPKMNIVVRNGSEINSLSKRFIPIELGRCNESNLPENNELRDYLSKNPIENMYCIQNYTPIELEGSLDTLYYKYISIDIAMCVNDTSSKTICQDPKIIEKVINNGEIYFTYSSYAVNPSNYENPFFQHGNLFAAPINTNSKTDLSITLQHIQINTDDGFITERLEEEKALNKLNDRTIIINKLKTDPLLFKMRIQLDKLTKNYSRKYDKLQDVLAQTGGAIKIILIFSIILVKPIVNLSFLQDLCNDIFNYEIFFDDNNKIDEKKKKKGMKQKVNLNFLQYIFSFIFTNGDMAAKRRHFDKTIEILDYKLSIAHFLNKLIEIEKLKFILLNSNQSKAFDYIPKPIISIKKSSLKGKKSILTTKSIISSTYWHEKILKGSSKIDKNKIFLTYDHLKTKNNKTEIDDKLINNLEKALSLELEKEANSPLNPVSPKIHHKGVLCCKKLFRFFRL